MSAKVAIQKVQKGNAPEVAVMVGELLDEIMEKTGEKTFGFQYDIALDNLLSFIEKGIYTVFLALHENKPVGFISLHKNVTLDNDITKDFGAIPELYVRPGCRSQKVGYHLLEKAKEFAKNCKWKRLEVTTPPLPAFNRTLQFYQKEGFSLISGRTLQVQL